MDLLAGCKDCSQKIKDINNITNGVCEKCSVHIVAYNRYWESNIPISYWDLHMKDFKGPKELLDVYSEFTSDLKKSYINGSSICLAGTHGIGKTYITTNILKKACHKNYNCLYTTLGDIVAVLIDAGNDKFTARSELIQTDILVIDEFDPRYSPTEMGADLFGRTLEIILRTRIQNKLPTLMCSNSPNVLETFAGSVKVALDSLMSGVKIIAVLGKDDRKRQRKLKDLIEIDEEIKVDSDRRLKYMNIPVEYKEYQNIFNSDLEKYLSMEKDIAGNLKVENNCYIIEKIFIDQVKEDLKNEGQNK